VHGNHKNAKLNGIVNQLIDNINTQPLKLETNLLFLIFCTRVFSSCTLGSGYEKYVTNYIKPLSIRGVILNKYEEETGCFGAIVVKQENSIDTIRKIFTCTVKEEKVWDFVLPNDSIYKQPGALSVIVVRAGLKSKFTFPTRD
jgi:hypothetical protein